MALRVLVADYSESISKAIYLSLEDLAVKIQPITPDKLTQPNDTSLSLEKNIVEMVSSFNPSIIFLDTLLAKINGYELAKILKSDESTKTIPIILMYSSITGISEEKLQASNADDILEKPFTQEKLRYLVTKYLKIDSLPLGPIGEEVELPLIEDLKEDIMAQIQDEPYHLKNQSFSDKTSEHTQTSDKNNNTSKPKGLINSDLELKELQISLSELDGEEDFQQVNLFPSATPNKTKKEDTPIDNISMPDFSNIDFTDSSTTKQPENQPQTDKDDSVKPPLPKPTVSPNLFNKKPFQINVSKPSNKDKKLHTDIHSQKTIDDLLQKNDTSPLQNKEEEDSITIPSSETDKFFTSNITNDNEVKVGTKSPTSKPSEENSFDDHTFRLNITADNIADDEINIESLEPEEDMDYISFLTAPDSQTPKVQQTDKNVHSKKQGEKVQSPLDKGLQEDMKKIICEEVKKITQEQIQRTLNKELPQMAKKLIKEEIVRLLSEYK